MEDERGFGMEEERGNFAVDVFIVDAPLGNFSVVVVAVAEVVMAGTVIVEVDVVLPVVVTGLLGGGWGWAGII